MIRGAGGGAPPISFGGNAAYSQHEFPTRSSFLYYSYQAYVGAGGTGPEPGNFDVHQTIPFFGGGPGYPLAGWGGGAGAVISGAAGTYETVPNFPSVITGAGGEWKCMRGRPDPGDGRRFLTVLCRCLNLPELPALPVLFN